MANWKTKILLADLHKAYKADEMPIEKVAATLAERLKSSPYAKEPELEGSIEELINLSQTEEEYDDENQDTYDCILQDLYDFGDQDHRIWFEAF